MDLPAPPKVILAQALQRYSKKRLARILDINPVTITRWESGGMSQIDAFAVLGVLQGSPVRARAERSGEFRFVDLFAGIGGMRIAFESYAVGGKCVFTCEKDLGCQKTYQANFPDDSRHFFGDITEITQPVRQDEMSERELTSYIREWIPEHDVLLAGFPCQPFSIAGVSKKKALGRAHGFACETQGTLFFDIAKILQARRPAAFLLENVKNLETHDRGRTFQVIRDVLEKDLHYKIYPLVRDAKGFVPQHRERIFIVGFREDAGFSWDAVPQPNPSSRVLRDILHPEDGSEEPERHYTLGRKAMVNADKYVLSRHLWDYLRAYKRKHERKGNGFGYGLFGKDEIARTLSARYYKDGSEILIRRSGNSIPRRLTPRECARLMGFDYGGRRFTIPEAISDTRAYMQFGNAVVVPLVEEIAKVMKQPLMRLLDSEQTGVRQQTLL